MNPFWDHPFVKPVVVAILIASVFALWKAFKSVPKKSREKLEEALQSVILRATEPIRKELTANDGSSLRDMVKRIEIALFEAKEAITAEEIWRWAMLGIDDRYVAVFKTNATGGLTHMSSQVLQWTGCTLQQIEGQRWLRMIAPEEQDAVAIWWSVVSSRGSSGDRKITYIDSEGKPFPVRVTAIPFFHPKTGSLMGHTGKITRLDRVE